MFFFYSKDLMWLAFLIIIVALFLINTSACSEKGIQRTQKIKDSGGLCDYTKLCTHGIKMSFILE